MDLVVFGLFSKLINSSFLFGWQEIVKKSMWFLFRRYQNDKNYNSILFYNKKDSSHSELQK